MYVYIVSSSIGVKVTESDNKNAISSQDLALSMTKAASTAKTFGVSLDELLGYTTAIGVATRESGSIVGNSLKTIMSRITTNQQAIGALADIGINIESSSGVMKDVSDIITELAGKWKDLTAAEQQNTAVKVAGTNQLSRFRNKSPCMVTYMTNVLNSGEVQRWVILSEISIHIVKYE